LQFLPHLVFGHRLVAGDEHRTFAWLSHHDRKADRCYYQSTTTNGPDERSIHDYFLLVFRFASWYQPSKSLASDKSQAA
jgi:hypothetical protein